MLAKSRSEISEKILSSKLEFRGLVPNDKYLWQSIKEGNELSFSILYKRYTKLLYNYGMHSCHDRDLVKDCLQEIFTALWDKRRGLSDVYAVNAYLFKSFRRLLLKKLNWRKRFSIALEYKDEALFEIMVPVEYTIEQDEQDAARVAKLKYCISALAKRQREALFLKFYNNLNYSDIASIMELQVDSVYNLISKAIDCLRSHMVK